MLMQRPWGGDTFEAVRRSRFACALTCLKVNMPTLLHTHTHLTDQQQNKKTHVCCTCIYTKLHPPTRTELLTLFDKFGLPSLDKRRHYGLFHTCYARFTSSHRRTTNTTDATTSNTLARHSHNNTHVHADLRFRPTVRPSVSRILHNTVKQSPTPPRLQIEGAKVLQRRVRLFRMEYHQRGGGQRCRHLQAGCDL